MERAVSSLQFVSAVDNVLSRAVEVLKDLPESAVAARMRADMPACIELLAARCAELPRLLATTQKADGLMEWSI